MTTVVLETENLLNPDRKFNSQMNFKCITISKQENTFLQAQE